MAINFQPPYIQTLDISIENLPIQSIDVLRLDAIHPVVSGNKWYKLKGHIDYIKTHRLEGFVTFGGAFSNHLRAAAYAAKAYGIKAHAIIRGEEFAHQPNATLAACMAENMTLEYVSRSSYKHKADAEYLASLQARFPNSLIIPEGGNSPLGLLGFEALRTIIADKYTHVAVSVGSGTTFLALRQIMPASQQLIGFVPMKNGRYLSNEFQLEATNWTLIDDYHFGGFGKKNEILLTFMHNFYQQYNIPLDVVYTAKMFYGLVAEIQQDRFSFGDKILVIHTGGLQGNSSLNSQLIY